jgi:hypothetical protein
MDLFQDNFQAFFTFTLNYRPLPTLVRC